jgi:hypothetical protein
MEGIYCVLCLAAASIGDLTGSLGVPLNCGNGTVLIVIAVGTATL